MTKERVLFPTSGFTTSDAAGYYARVAKYLLPHLRNRPASIKRYPDTIEGESFWEKDAPGFTPKWVRRFSVARRGGRSAIDYIVINDARTLRWVADIGGIEIHPFLHRVDAPERPTHVVFDLDPGEGTTIRDCCQVALLLRDALAAAKLESLAKVSGSKGLQLYVPLNTPVTHDTTETFARLVAGELARAHPRSIVARSTKALRRGRVFIDWSQNAAYKTTVAVYSLRAKRDRPYVSMPLRWKEVERGERLDFDPASALKRLTRLGDLFAPLLKMKQHLPPLAAAKESVSIESEDEVIVHGIRLPKPKSQSGRRLFVLMKTEMGNELWLAVAGKFRRWILRPDRDGEAALIAMPAGQFPVAPDYYAGRVPKEWSRRVGIEDIGSYELIEGSDARQRYRLWFTGTVMAGEWTLEKIDPDARHRSWSLRPNAAARP